MFRALSHRNYRRFWVGAFLSNVGTWMQAVAQGWLVLQLTDSALWLGLDAFMATVPGFFLTLAGGVFADIVDRRRLLLYSQVVAGLAAFGLAILVGTNLVNVWMILGFSFVTGCCMALAGPSYQAMTFDLVGREDLANAVALNSSQFQLSRVIGPVFAGFGFKFFGLAGCFFANGISFIAVVIALNLVRFDKSKQNLSTHSVKDRRALWRDLIEGFRYVRNRPRVFSLLSISAVTSSVWCPLPDSGANLRSRHFQTWGDRARLDDGYRGSGGFFRRAIAGLPGRLSAERLVGVRGCILVRGLFDLFCPLNRHQDLTDFSLRGGIFDRNLGGCR